MKNIYCLILACCALCGCNKGFLDLEPSDDIPASSFYKTAADMEAALNSAYASLQDPGQYGTAYWQVGEVRSDNTYNWDGAGNFPDAEIDQFKESSSNPILEDMWLDSYRGILLCNIVGDRIVAVEMDEQLKKRFSAEALFLRSLMYFNLVRAFGDVPLPLHEFSDIRDSYTYGRIPVEEVYDQIIEDLLSAHESLPDVYPESDMGRATKGAAKSLLGKILLTRGEYASSAAVLEEVIGSGTYELLPVYSDLWDTDKANNKESIFEVQFKKGGTETGSAYNNFFAPYNSEAYVTSSGFAYGRNLPNKNLVNAYEPGDKRKYASLAETYRRRGEDVYDPYTIKFRDIPVTERDSDNNWPVLRYADVLLMYAEARNEMNGIPDSVCYSMINQVRERAGLLVLQPGLNKELFAQALEHERQVELAFEGHRWFDLVRTDRALEVMNGHFNGAVTLKPYQLLFPVPQSQINVNPGTIRQNVGY